MKAFALLGLRRSKGRPHCLSAGRTTRALRLHTGLDTIFYSNTKGFVY